MELNIKTPLNTLLGYGKAGWNITKELANNIDISLFPISKDQIYLTTSEDIDLIKNLIEYATLKFNKQAKCLTIWHEFDLISNFIGKNEHIGFPFFEIDTLDDIRKSNLNYCDRIFVASQWAKDVLKNNGIFPDIEVVPLGVDTNIFFPKKDRMGPYKFFTIGKIENRKCTFLLPDIFSYTFNSEDDVELHILCDSTLPQIKRQMIDFRVKCNQAKLSEKIKLVPILKTEKELAQFIQSMDCGIFLTKSEGFGLPILESMACGKSVITTNYSGHTEFCNNDNSMLIDIYEFEEARDNIWFHGLGKWAKIENRELEACVDYMKYAYENRPFNQNGVNTSRRFTWANTAKKIERLL